MEKKRPVHEVKSGAVRIAVWANATKNGTHYSLTVSRRYKAEGDEWKSSSSFSLRHIPLITGALEEASAWLTQQEVKA